MKNDFILSWDCKNCGKQFPKLQRVRKFCSPDCYHEYARRFPNRGTFQGGHKTWNKNVKGLHLSPETEFKKGVIPDNKKPVHTVTIRRTKRGVPRRFIKVGNQRWINYPNYIWRISNGRIPRGFYLHHINRNPLDDRLENLSPVTRSTHINLHRPQLLEAKKRLADKMRSIPRAGDDRQAETIGQEVLKL